jgi:tRNA G18 (ribose-2'-O)-methylase SpoU
MTDANEDTRNVIDKYKDMAVGDIKADLDSSRIGLEIAIENLERDFNMGTIVRTANAFNVSRVHIVGRRQWNKRGAMVTDRYMNIEYHPSARAFLDAMAAAEKSVVAIDIVKGAKDLSSTQLPKNAVLVYGSEKSGLSATLLSAARQVVQIEQTGSTRSMNVGVAAGISMYMWLLQHELNH